MLGGGRALGIAFAMLLLAACSGAGGEDSSPEAAPPAASPTQEALRRCLSEPDVF
jgi:hypothetical protein